MQPLTIRATQIRLANIVTIGCACQPTIDTLSAYGDATLKSGWDIANRASKPLLSVERVTPCNLQICIIRWHHQ